MDDVYTTDGQVTDHVQEAQAEDVSAKTEQSAEQPKSRKAPKKPNIHGDKNRSIRFTLTMMVTLPAVITMLVTLLYARSAMTDGMEQEMIDGLVLMAESIKGGYNETAGDYTLGDDGCIYKGDTNLTPTEESMDIYTANLDADVTLCWGKTRMATTIVQEDGSRAAGTDIADEVWATVQTGETYKTNDIQILGEDYFAVYVPLENTDGTVVGAVFAGRPCPDVSTFINQKVRTLVVLAVIILVICNVVGFFVANVLAKVLKKASEMLAALSQGQLNVTIDERILKRKDEIGRMGVAIQALLDKLREIVGQLKQSSNTLYTSGNSLDEMAGQTSAAADEIGRAVEDISKGAVSQAEEIESASQEIATMGEVIEDIVHSAGSLTNTSENMTVAGNASQATMKELSESNDRTTAAIARIGEQIRSTNASIEKIGAAATLITSIADQTSLLSLNASIESARAGEAGRGFAVVAGEIQKLAVQSDEAAAEIQQIIDTLLAESEQTMAVMEQAESLVAEQQQKLDATKQRFSEVNDGITVSREGTDVIRGNAGSCNRARTQVVDVISNLSAISQENAASAQETTASMEELNATINMLAEAAGNLKVLSEQLNEEMDFFQM